jgi:hypothetical protein
MFYITDKHQRLLDAMNHAKNELEHRLAREFLRGYRDGLKECGYDPGLMGCDLYYIDQGIDRPMCCGEWLDWEPEEQHDKA